MYTLTAILETDADGTLHLPMPPGNHKGKWKVTVTFSAVDAAEPPLRALNPTRDRAEIVALWKEIPPELNTSDPRG